MNDESALMFMVCANDESALVFMVRANDERAAADVYGAREC